VTKANFGVSEGAGELIDFLGCTLARTLAMSPVQHAAGSPTPRRLSTSRLLPS
jgi:hypothetical protein